MTCLAALLALVLVSCAGPSRVPVAPGDRVQVTFFDARQGITLALANASHPELHDVYSTRRDDPHLKLAPDELIGRLLGALRDEGLSRWGDQGLGEPTGDRGYLLVDRGRAGRTLFLEPGPGSTPEEHRAFIRMKLLVDDYYSTVGSLQFIENEEGASLFKDGA